MPIFRYPFFYNNYYGNYYNRPYSGRQNYLPKATDNSNSPDFLHNDNINSHSSNSSSVSSGKESSRHNFSSDLENKKNNSKEKSGETDYFFELFGLKLYFDDILLICLIFFLYQEGVRDDELFISLVLLLLS